MKPLYMFCILALLLSGCSGFNEYMREQASKPRYEKQYRPISGQLDSATLSNIMLICKSRANLHADKADAEYKNSSSTTKCKKNPFGEVTCSSTSGLSHSQQVLERQAHYLGTSVWHKAFKSYHRACMAENGLSLQNVCVRNCY